MDKKLKKRLYRIIITLVVFVVLMVLMHATTFSDLPYPVLAAIFLVPYIFIGFDVIKKAFINIKNGQVFDENFLMMIATVAAFVTGEFSEALAVMLFYQTGELFQDVLKISSGGRHEIISLCVIFAKSAEVTLRRSLRSPRREGRYT